MEARRSHGGARTLSDAHVVNAVREAAWTTKVNAGGVVVRKLCPEGLYGRRKMTAYLRRAAAPDASAGSVDRAMRALELLAAGPVAGGDPVRVPLLGQDEAAPVGLTAGR